MHHSAVPWHLALTLSLLGCTQLTEAPTSRQVEAHPSAVAQVAAPWTTYGYDDENTQHNRGETELRSATAGQLREQWRYRFSDGATGTPVVLDDTVYFGGWNGDFYAADARSGELRWQRHLTHMGIRSTPLIVQDTIYVAAGTSLIALVRTSGEIVFESELDSVVFGFIDSSPKWLDGLIVLGTASGQNGLTEGRNFFGKLIALDAQTGAEVWHVSTTGPNNSRCPGGAGAAVWSSVAVDHALGLLYVGTGQAYEAPISPCSDALLAIRYGRQVAGDRIAWLVQYTANDIFNAFDGATGLDADVGAAPNLFKAQGRDVVGAGDKAGSYRVFDRRTGQPVWRADLQVGSYTGYGGVMTTAAVSGDTIVVASNQVELNLLDIASGLKSRLYALERETGRVRWSVPLPSASVGSMAIASDLVFHHDFNGNVYARELASGNAVWQAQVPGSAASLSVASGRLYVSSGFGLLGTGQSDQDGIVSSFGLADGPKAIWEPQPEPPQTLTFDQCRKNFDAASAWSIAERPNAACASCMCECNPTASGNCDACWLLTSCASSLCALATPGDGVRSCLEDFCTAKLLPNYILDSLVEVTPCTARCAAVCAF